MAVELYNYPTFYNHANLVHYWRLEGNSNDAKGSNNGTDANITYSTGNGLYGQGAGFNGSSSKIDFANPSIGAAFTIMMWIKPTNDLGNSSEALFHTHVSSVGDIQLRGNSGGTASTLKYGIGGVGTTNTSSTIGNWAGTWHHLALVGTGSNTLRVVADGVSIGSNTFGGNYDSTEFVLGNINNADWFNGAMDDVAYFSTNIATADILAYYNATSDTGFLQMF